MLEENKNNIVHIDSVQQTDAIRFYFILFYFNKCMGEKQSVACQCEIALKHTTLRRNHKNICKEVLCIT